MRLPTTSDMQEMVRIFPDLLTMQRINSEILEEAGNIRAKGFQGICLVGMGGSAISGEIARGILASQAKVPILSITDYILPLAVRQNWVVIAVSYSGNTEETIAAFNEAQARGCTVFAITTGGKLSSLCETKLLQSIPTGLQPRAALPLIFSALYSLLCELLALDQPDFESLRSELQRRRTQWKKEEIVGMIVEQLCNYVPFFIGWRHLAPVAYRAKCQMNENAKMPSFSSSLPEMNHNEIEAIRDYTKMKIRPIFLKSIFADERATLRTNATQKILQQAGISFIDFQIEGSSILAESLATTMFWDEVSVALALRRGADPISIPRITELKKILQQNKE